MPQELKRTKRNSKRRGNNEGSIYQRQSGDWCGQVSTGHKPDGKLIRKTLYGKTRQEVAIKITTLSGEVFTNGYSTVSANEMREFCVLYENWFSTFKAPTIKTQTQERYRNFMKNHFNPVFGNMNVQDITLVQFQQFFNEKAQKGYAAQTIKHMKQALSQFYEYAVKQKLVSLNPIADVKIRDTERRNERMALTPQQREVICKALDQEVLLKPILLTFIMTGLRPQELIALKWKNIDFESSVISVEAATNREVSFDESGNVVGRRLVIGNTKTAGSVRKFPAPAVVMEALKEWKTHLSGQEQAAGVTVTTGDCFVFSSQKGTMRTYSGLRSLLIRFLKRIGLDGKGISLYTFRHTFATMLLERRENPKIVSTLMGHSKVLTTLSIYSHVISNDVYEDTTRTLDAIYVETMQK